MLENILIQNLLKENRECNKIVAMFVEQNRKSTHPYELQVTRILFENKFFLQLGSVCPSVCPYRRVRSCH